MENQEQKELRTKIYALIRRYHESSTNKFIPDETYVQASGKSFDADELVNGVDAVLDGWWTEGRFTSKFSSELGRYLGVNFVRLVNSGSSANLVAFSSLTSHLLGERRIMPGDEVITVAAGFPTTINPIIQSGAIPVFVDVEIGSYNAIFSEIEKAITAKTKAIVLAHTLGVPFDLERISSLCKKNKLWLMEDCCDALGATYDGKKVGTFGDIATLSFYPAHQITAGEGGAVFTNDPTLARIASSIRDWGRSCYCMPGKDNTCGQRFTQQHGELPFGYDHKYVYSHIGYNLKMTDMQAAIGLAQLAKLPGFISRRKKNFQELYRFFKDHEDIFYLPKIDPRSEPSHFGFLLTIKEGAGFTRNDIVQYLDEHKIGTRLLFSGNVTKQPYFLDNSIRYRTVSSLKNTDIIMKDTFWIGVQPNITDDMLQHVKDTFNSFLKKISIEVPNGKAAY